MINAYKKILDNVVTKNDSLPILKGVHYENGNMVATDSHQLVLFKDVVKDKKLNVTIDLSTYLPIDISYPETDWLIPTEHATQLVFHHLGDIKGLVYYLKASKKQVVDMTIKDQGLTLRLHDNPCMIYSQEIEWNGDDLEISYNASYLYNALAYLDHLFNVQPIEYTGKTTVINFNGDLRPFTVEFGNMVYLIGPVRIY